MKVALIIMAFAFGDVEPNVNTFTTYPATVELCEKMQKAIPGEVTDKQSKIVYKLFAQCLVDEKTPLEDYRTNKNPNRRVNL